MPFSPDVPSIKRRLMVMVYEILLLFGITFITTLAVLLIFKIFFGATDTLLMQVALRCWLFLILGAYFCWHWCRTGQTLPMKTWSLRLVTLEGRPVHFKRAVARYMLGWLWLLPGLAIAWATGATGWTALCLVLANVVAWTLTARMHPSRQFLHDRMAGTQIINYTPSK